MNIDWEKGKALNSLAEKKNLVNRVWMLSLDNDKNTIWKLYELLLENIDDLITQSRVADWFKFHPPLLFPLWFITKASWDFAKENSVGEVKNGEKLQSKKSL